MDLQPKVRVVRCGEDDLRAIDVHAILNDTSLSSRERAFSFFAWMIHPMDPAEFFDECWERRPLLIKRGKAGAKYFDGWFSMQHLDSMFKDNNLTFGKDVDVTSYTSKRPSLQGPVSAKVVWDHYKNRDCSVRTVHPQQWCSSVARICSMMEDVFGVVVGSNSYLTPPDSQGFPPHYDDVEVFLMQTEGKKRWRLYGFRSENEALARKLTEVPPSELKEPILDELLEEGDLLYFPRGMIHQGVSPPGTHSLHLTVSTYQKYTWYDLLKQTLLQGLDNAMANDVRYREGLPLHLLDLYGVHNPLKKHKATVREAKVFESNLVTLTRDLAGHLPLESVWEHYASERLSSAMPPFLPSAEEKRRKKPKNVVGKTRIRLLTQDCVRICPTDDEEIVLLKHSCNNPFALTEKGSDSLEFGVDFVPALEYLIKVYPAFVKVNTLPLEDEGDMKDLAQLLHDEGIVVSLPPKRKHKEHKEESGEEEYGKSNGVDGDHTKGNGVMGEKLKKKRKRKSTQSR